MAMITINPDLCKHCGACVQSCPEAVFVRMDKQDVPTIANPDLCITCGQCVVLCSQSAITHRDYPQESLHPVIAQNRPSPDQVLTLLKTRRSVRAFKRAPVERHLIEQVIEGARFAPSAHNVQSTHFIVLQDVATLRHIVDLTVGYVTTTARQLRNPIIRVLASLVMRDEIAGALPLLDDFDMLAQAHRNGEDKVLHHAPVLLVAHASRHVNLADVNANLALQNAMLTAHSLGLGSFYAGYVAAACQRESRLARVLALPPRHRVYGALALGHPRYVYDHWIERCPPQVAWSIEGKNCWTSSGKT